MSGDPQRYFECFFRELEARGIPYVILHSYENMPAVIASDIDYAVMDADFDKIPAIQHEVAQRVGWELAQSLQHQVCASYSVLMDPSSPVNFLKLDACSHYVKDRCFLIRDSTLLGGRRRFRDFYVPSPAAEFIYVLAKVFGKNRNVGDYLPRLRTLWEQDREGAQRHFDALFGDTGARLEEWFTRPAPAWRALNEIMRARNRYGIALLLREFVRVMKRAMHPTGLHIALLGPDGAGKSTLLAQIQRLMEPCFRRQQVFHFRPMLFQKKSRGPVSAPHAQPPRNPAAAFAKVIYYFCDNLAGWFLKVLPGKLCSTLVIFDRNFDDMLVDQKRYRIGNQAGLVRWLRIFLPRADLVFVLDAPAEIIHARKPELPVPELERQLAALRQIAGSDDRHVPVSADEPPDKVASTACRKIVETLASRTRRNLEIPR